MDKVQENHKGDKVASFQPAPGEYAYETAKFHPSLIIFWLTTNITVTNQRIAWTQPNTIFKIIPLGSNQNFVPLTNTASVGVNTQFSVGTAVLGIIELVVGITLIGKAPLAGVLLILLALIQFLNAMAATLIVTNNAGAQNRVELSILERGKLQAFAQKINNQLFADHGHMRHQESMGMQSSQLSVQQAQLDAMRQSQNAATPHNANQTPLSPPSPNQPPQSWAPNQAPNYLTPPPQGFPQRPPHPGQSGRP